MEHRTELFRLLSALADGQLLPTEHDRLEELLADRDARRLYLEYVDLHARLLTHPDLGGDHRLPGVDALAGVIGDEAAAQIAAPASRSPQVITTTKTANSRRLKRVRRIASYVAVAIATVAATILVQLYVGQSLPPVQQAEQPPELPGYVATLAEAANVEWGAATDVLRPGSRLLAGEMELKRGIARIGFDSSVELIVEGPARLKLESSDSATIIAGKVVFRADDAAAPFTLRTPSSVLVDLGTEYAVEVDATQEEIHVFSGEVERLPKAAAKDTQPQLLAAGEARRYGGTAAATGEAAAIEPEKFVRQLPLAEPSADSSAGLLAYEGFDYSDAEALRNEMAKGGVGFRGAWGDGFARAVNEKIDDQMALNPLASLERSNAPTTSVGGSFEHVGFAKYFRRLETPVRLDADGVYYLSFLFRREGPPADLLNSVSVQFRQTEELARDNRDGTRDLRLRMNFGVDRTNDLFAHLERIGCRMPLPLSYGQTYLFVAKIAASGTHSDQLFLRVYGPEEPVDLSEPAGWSAIGPPIQSDLVFDWLEVHINSHTRQAIDEIRLGTTWSSVTAAWAAKP
jgi:hypothetical protein